ncbi:MAG: hypothetical protein HN411_04530 [Waddliaceae bacterium]|jgi:hypothetical protein|nr:hypothetical protein [Waddliaceae bacterium]MBT3579313.1 hypothetical protein [Waddliaceae bacterium]MBT4445444.1 hypothetical protein [Waddliaceae bacterium]MBT6928569.1 hypothetical protein [Waddliaceae bacterium]MBT7264894.1 hypothetical protein [Waddliaceae bacterium]
MSSFGINVLSFDGAGQGYMTRAGWGEAFFAITSETVGVPPIIERTTHMRAKEAVAAEIAEGILGKVVETSEQPPKKRQKIEPKDTIAASKRMKEKQDDEVYLFFVGSLIEGLNLDALPWESITKDYSRLIGKEWGAESIKNDGETYIERIKNLLIGQEAGVEVDERLGWLITHALVKTKSFDELPWDQITKKIQARFLAPYSLDKIRVLAKDYRKRILDWKSEKLPENTEGRLQQTEQDLGQEDCEHAVGQSPGQASGESDRHLEQFQIAMKRIFEKAIRS